ncbi:Kinesin-like protein kip2 [Tilletia horrida]|uniref:Kinesin-like protein kip2 n=1 Tax=Tilletia horrida TaxID=155126 RepID=A0AAN6GGA0_9BASI|nr:Kinesin-like protein kip2 [Tilletia horrida]
MAQQVEQQCEDDAANTTIDPFRRPPSPETGILPDREEQPLLGASLGPASSNPANRQNSNVGLGLGLGLGLGPGFALPAASVRASSSSSGPAAIGVKVLRPGRTVTASGSRVGVDIESPKGSPGRAAPFMPNRKRGTRLTSKGSSGTDDAADQPTGGAEHAHAHARAAPLSDAFASLALHRAAASDIVPESAERLHAVLSESNEGQRLMRSRSVIDSAAGPSSRARTRAAAAAQLGARDEVQQGGPPAETLRHLADGSARQNIRAAAATMQPGSHLARSVSPSRPASPTKEAGLRMGGPRARNGTGAAARPLSMYDAPSSASTPFQPASAGNGASEAIAKKRQQMAAAKRLKDARDGNLVASISAVSSAGCTPPRVRRDRDVTSSPTRGIGPGPDGDRRRPHLPTGPFPSAQHRLALPELDPTQPSVLDSIAIPIMDEDDADGDSSFVYDGDQHTQMGDADASDPFRPEFASSAESVQVHVRIRPPRGEDDDLAWDAYEAGRSVSLVPALANARVAVTTTAFNFDGVHTSSANKPIYLSVARPLVRSVLDGFDAVVFAYGQTGSGKTWTLSGDDVGREPGIMPRAIKDIFSGIRQASTTREFLIRVSYMEVYNEQLKDLLVPSNVPQIRDEARGGRRGTVVKPLQEEVVTTPAQVMALLALGQANRHVGATDWNERSSRSHTAFKMTIESWERVSDEPWATELDPDRAPGSPAKQRTQGRTVRVSELSLIDLAGSERYFSKGGSAARSEGSAINKSLLCLGRVIAALSAAKEGQYVPFRDSKLTRILQNSLSGNARVAVVCTLNPSSTAVEESLSTLSFAKRVKKVSLHAQRNEIDAVASLGSEGQALVMRYRAEAESLRKQVRELEARSAVLSEGAISAPMVPVDDERIQELRHRLEQIGGLIMVGGGEEEEEEDDDDEEDGRKSPLKRPMSPTKRGFRFDEGVPALQEKLFKANARIRELESRLSGRPSLPPPTTTEGDKDNLILQLKKQVHELELVCEAQTAQGPLPRIREDVEGEWTKKVEYLQAELGKRDRFVLDLSRECHSLRNTNRQLMRLAHLDASTAVLNLGLSGSSSGATTPRPTHSASPPFGGGIPPTSPTPPRPRPRAARRSVSMGMLVCDESRLL